MTPVPLHLPLRLHDAAELAGLVFDHAERKPLSEEVRGRLASRAAAMKLESVTPWFGSLARDPVHPSTYYLAVDAGQTPYLLHMAPAAAPTSSIFHKPLLIGRTRRQNGPEVVINAIPFGPDDRETIDRFTGQVDAALQPRPQGSRASITVRSDYARAFDLFRALYKRHGRNLAAVAGGYHACVWAAIRCGYRQEYSVVAEIGPEGLDEAGQRAAGYTRFAVDVASLPHGESALKAAEHAHEQIRQARAQLKNAGGFEFEVGLGEAGAEELRDALGWLKERGHAAQFARAGTGDVEGLAEVARQHKVTLSFSGSGESDAAMEAAVRATAGRFNLYVDTPEEAGLAAEWVLG